ncbi:MAG: hypothetical protein Q9225_007998, partial [Loekoesia sp. 1 TL-2023]
RLEKATKACAGELKDEFQDSIFHRYEAAIQSATWEAIHIAAKWGAPVNRGDRAAGGLYWATYKAICRRDGCFTNAQGLHDWNAQLIEPMIKLIAPGWEKVFTRRVQIVMTNFTKTVPATLKRFHQDIENRARKIGTGLASLSMLSHQITVYDQILKDLAATTKDMITTRQKDINREFVPVIENAMHSSYTWCSNEVGPGQFKRMKAYMTDHVEQARQTMFHESANEIKRQLGALVHDVEETLADKTDEVFIQIKRDYRSVLGGGEVSQGEVIPRVQRQVRKEIKRIIDGVERMMKKVVGLEVEESREIKEDADDDFSETEDSDPTKTEAADAESAQLGIKAELDGQPSVLEQSGSIKSEEDDGTAFTASNAEEDHDSPMQDGTSYANSFDRADRSSSVEAKHGSEREDDEGNEDDEDEDENEDEDDEEDESFESADEEMEAYT